MGVAAIGAAVAAGGTLLQMEGQAREAEAQKRQAEQEQANRMSQSQEILMRAYQSEQATRLQGQLFSGRQLSASAKSGFTPAGATMSVIANTAHNLEYQIINMRREAQFRATQLRAGAIDISREIDDMQRATRLKQTGTFLGGAYKTYSGLYDPNSGQTDTLRARPGSLGSQGSYANVGGYSGTVGPTGAFGSGGGNYA